MDSDVIIVGAGMAGLSCARALQQQGIDCRLVEASDGVGGRVRTDTFRGFLLDRGFQVLLTAYPETRRALNYDALDLHSFYPGALIYTDRGFQRLTDYRRRPKEFLPELRSSIATLSDKARLARLSSHVTRRPAGELAEDVTVLEGLRARTFSERFIQTFFRPFFAGVFLEPTLSTTWRQLEFVLRMFSTGRTALPAGGMGSLAEHLATQLAEDSVTLRSKVESVGPGLVTLGSGEKLTCRAVVLASEGPEANRLVPSAQSPPYHEVTCIYFSCSSAPIQEPILILNGTGTGPINNMCFPSRISRSYAKSDAELVSVTVLGNPKGTNKALNTAVRAQLRSWFGSTVESWEHLRTYRIAHALPSQRPSHASLGSAPQEPGIFACGDYFESASINGAMASGRQAAAAVAASLGARNGETSPDTAA